MGVAKLKTAGGWINLVGGNATVVSDDEPVGAAVGTIWLDTDAVDDEPQNTYYVHALDYGNLSENVGDAALNVATLQAAATAASAIRANVLVPGMTIPINANVAFPAYAGLIGAGRQHTIFLATHANAKLTFTEPSFATIEAWEFDGDSIADYAVQVKGATNALSMRDIWIHHADRGISFHNLQNSIVDKLAVDTCHRGVSIADGCGSVVFNSLAIANFVEDLDTVYGLFIGYEGVESSGYTESTALTFIAPMIEVLVDDDTATDRGVIVVEGTSRAHFINANIVNGWDGWIIRAGVISPAQEVLISFQSCYIGGSPATSHAISVNGGQLEFIGRNLLNGFLTGIQLNGAGSNILGNTPHFGDVGTKWVYTGGASWHGNLLRPDENGRFVIKTDDGWIPAFLMGQGTEAFYRTFLYGDGRLGFGDNSTASDVELQRGGANMMTMADGDSFRVQGTWNGGMLRIGDYRLWVDSTGDLRIKNSAPASDTDGTVVGTQS